MHTRILTMLALLLTPFAVECAADEPKFGVVTAEDKNLCVSFGKTVPLADVPITIVLFEDIQTAFEGKIVAKIKQCSLLEKAQIAGPYFSVSTNAKFASPFVGVAIQGKYRTVVENGIASLSVEGAKDNIYFRMCTSSEAFHFSSWRGRPLVGKQIWHQYYYLGYDVEPSCVKKDFLDERM